MNSSFGQDWLEDLQEILQSKTNNIARISGDKLYFDYRRKIFNIPSILQEDEKDKVIAANSLFSIRNKLTRKSITPLPELQGKIFTVLEDARTIAKHKNYSKIQQILKKDLDYSEEQDMMLAILFTLLTDFRLSKYEKIEPLLNLPSSKEDSEEISYAVAKKLIELGYGNKEEFENQKIEIKKSAKRYLTIADNIEEQKQKVADVKKSYQNVKIELGKFKQRVKELSEQIDKDTLKADKKKIKEEIKILKDRMKSLKENPYRLLKEQTLKLKNLRKEKKNIKDNLNRSYQAIDFNTLLSETNEDILASAQSNIIQYKSEIVDAQIRKHIPYTKEYDTEIYVDSDPSFISEIEKQSEPYIQYLNQVFTKYLKTKKEEVQIRGLKRGKLDRFALHKQSNRIFKQIEERIKKDTCVSVLIDCSGSMVEQSQNAMSLAYIIEQSVKSFKIPVEVLGYTTQEIYPTISDKLDAPVKKLFTRIDNALIHYIFKSFDNSTLNLSNDLDRHYNSDGEAIIFAGKRLLAKKMKRKLLIVLSDGLPNLSECSKSVLINDLKIRIKELEHIGIEVLGIGIGSNHGANLYKKWLRIDNPNDLLRQSVKEFQKFLLKSNKNLR